MGNFGFGSKQKDTNIELTTKAKWSRNKVYKICQENKHIYVEVDVNKMIGDGLMVGAVYIYYRCIMYVYVFMRFLSLYFSQTESFIYHCEFSTCLFSFPLILFCIRNYIYLSFS